MPDQVWPVGTEIEEITLPRAPRATGAVRYSVDRLPAGVVFDRDTRTLSGRPTELVDFTATYTATDAAGKSASLTFDIAVNGKPSFLDVRIPNTVFALEEEGEIVLPALTRGNGTWDEHRFSSDPHPPSWLGLPQPRDAANPATLKLVGMPRENADAKTYTLIVTDKPVGNQDSGDEATLKFCFSVGDGDRCGVSFNGARVPDQTYTMGRSIKPPLQLPEVKLGPGMVTYSVSWQQTEESERPDDCEAVKAPEEPGLKFDPAIRTLHGAPTKAGCFTATYTVTDEVGGGHGLVYLQHQGERPAFLRRRRGGGRVRLDQGYPYQPRSPPRGERRHGPEDLFAFLRRRKPDPVRRRDQAAPRPVVQQRQPDPVRHAEESRDLQAAPGGEGRYRHQRLGRDTGPRARAAAV